MYRKDREIKEFDAIVDVLERCDTIHLGITGEEYPYVVPLSFGYEVKNGKIVFYIHGAKKGLKLDLLAKNNKVCVEADLCHGFYRLEDDVTTDYESIIGFGLAEPAEGEELAHGLDLILKHCGIPDYVCTPVQTRATAVYKITLEQVTGKRLKV